MQDLISLGMQGVNASYKALNVTGHNINNVDTPNYSRQQVVQQNSAISGVQISEVRRIYAQYNASSLQESTSNAGKWQAYLTASGGIDNLLGKIDNGLNAAISDFFSSVNQVSQNAGDLTARDLLLNSAQNLAAKFNELHTQINEQENSLQTEISGKTAGANALIKQIAELNKQISQNPSNEDLDAREQAIEQLSNLVAIKVTQKGDKCSVYAASGAALVNDDNCHLLNLSDNKITVGKQKLPLNDVGGALGGLLAAQENLISDAKQNLGQLAQKISAEVNNQLKQGVDLNGDLGISLFSDLTNIAAKDAARMFKVTLTDPKKLALAGSLNVSLNNSKVQITPNINNLNQDLIKQLPLTIKVIDANKYQILNVNNKVIKQDNIKDNKIILNDDISFNIKGELNNNEEFKINITSKNSNDNNNALKIAKLQNNINNKANNISHNIGVKINNANNQLKISTNNLNKYIELREVISGVNLDEEQANILKFQQYYDASAQIIKTAQTTFNTLINVI